MTTEDELTSARATIYALQAQLKQLMLEKHEPIAIVGIGLRMPGGSTTIAGLAEFLASGACAIAPIPPGRWDVAEFSLGGKICSSSGGFLADIDQFDASFFSISPKEARCIDPQQRLALETTWAALENAGINPMRLRRGNVGVYFGASSVDYVWAIGDLASENMDGYLAAGVLNAAVSGRVSYFLGARGPCLSVDTACSSSMVALHLAVSGLRGRECDLALCGGVSAIHHPYSSVMLTDMEALAPDGRCKTFDESADGYGRAEGCGVVVLKRLSDAERDGDTVLALIRGTAVRQDGESAGFTAPNGLAQEALMRAALANATLEPGDIQYVEAHGTGTPLGDPIEMASIAEVFGPSHDVSDPILVGSLKTNIGHMEAAAGIGGVIKTVLQMRHRTVFPHLNFDKPSSRIAWDTWPVRVCTQPQPWQARVRRAAVNSFGFAGTIACAVLEEAPAQAPAPLASAVEPGDGHVLTISAKSASSLAGQIRRYLELLAKSPDIDVADLCYTTNIGRAHFPHRVSGVVTGHDDLVALLEQSLSTLQRGELPAAAPRKVGFLFSGLGALSPGIGAALYRRHRVFAGELDACDELLSPLMGRSVKGMALGTGGPDDAEALNQARYGQPFQMAIQYALAKLWMSWGVRPNAIAGHSMGEVAAGAIAGLFSLADAARLITARARLADSARPGCMVSVGASADAVAPLLAGYGDVAVAAINAPQQCVISGGRDSIDAIMAALAEQDIDHQALTVSHASHSPLMTEITAGLRESLAGIRFAEPAITMISMVSGQVARPGEIRDVEYWVRHILEPVNFMGGMRTLDQRGKHVFIEIGPSATLTSLGRRCVPASRHVWLPSMHASDAGGNTLLTAVAKAYAAGQPISWPDLHLGKRRHRVELPGYSFDHRPYWLPTDPATKSPVMPAVPAGQAPAGQASGGPAPADEAGRAGAFGLASLATQAGGQRRAAITELIRQQVAAVLEYSDIADVSADVDFTDLGMDSLLAVKLRKALCACLSVSFPTPEVFNHPSPSKLAEFLDGQLDEQPEKQPDIQFGEQPGAQPGAQPEAQPEEVR